MASLSTGVSVAARSLGTVTTLEQRGAPDDGPRGYDPLTNKTDGDVRSVLVP